MSFISIIIPNYNGGRTINGCLESIFAVQDDGIEVIVVDDRSDDGSRDIIRAYPCRLIAREQRSGAAAARNAGAAQSRGEVLFFIDADCRLMQDTLPVLRKSLDKYPAGTVIGGTYTPMPADAGFFSRFQSVFINYSETKNSAHPDYIASHAMAVPADTFRLAGGFPEHFLPILEDVEFSHRLRRKGVRLVMDPDLQVRHQFDFTLGKSLRNAARKTRYWIEYSLTNKDLLSDSGTASIEMKINGIAWLLSVLGGIPVSGVGQVANSAGRAFSDGHFPYREQASVCSLPSSGRYCVRPYGRSILQRRLSGGDMDRRAPGGVAVWRKAAAIPAQEGLTGNVLEEDHLLTIQTYTGHSVERKADPPHLFRHPAVQFANCPFCFYLRSENAPVDPRPELSLGEIEKVSASLGSLLWLAFSGGEIFLRNDLVEIAGTFYRNNRPAIMLFPTNGLLPELIRERMETIVRSCPKSVIALKLSLDGLGDAHDELRRTPGSFAKTLRTYELVAGLADRYPNFELGVNTVFCSDNQNDMDGIIEYVRGLRQVKTHTISLVRGDLADKHFTDVDIDMYHDAVRKLEKQPEGREVPGLPFQGRAPQGGPGHSPAPSHPSDDDGAEMDHALLCRKAQSCAGRSRRGVPLRTAHGIVRECPRLWIRSEKGGAFGTAQNALRAIKQNKCFCTHECYFMTNILFNPRLYPALMKEYLLLRHPQ